MARGGYHAAWRLYSGVGAQNIKKDIQGGWFTEAEHMARIQKGGVGVDFKH